MKCADCKAPTGKRSDYYCDYCRGWLSSRRDAAQAWL
jgi:hypothetical protein